MNFPLTFLMCQPKYFEVSYVINPWMALHPNGISRQGALQEWQNLYESVSKRALVRLVDPQPGLPDMTFTANAGLIVQDKVVLSRFRHPERQGEEQHFQEWFLNNQYEVYQTPVGLSFEGAGDALLDRQDAFLWMGWGYRSELAANVHLSNYLDMEVLPLRLIDERFYHLDTCFCPLTDGYLLYYPAAFDEPTRRLIAQRVPRNKRIAVSEEDAVYFACNAVNIDDLLIINHVGSKLRNQLQEAGFEVIETGMTEFIKAGGGTKCLTLRLNEPPLVNTRAIESAVSTISLSY
jgi:N-dimethylarginine dimethylaminohydrolase